MNIFILHLIAKKCAIMHCDKHVVKMILESTLMLYTACWFVWYEESEGWDGTGGGVCQDLETRQKNSPLKAKNVAPKGYIPSWISTAPKSKNGGSGYRPTHINHPCSVWVRESLSNYLWLCDLAWELCMEYRYRYGDKKHACEDHLKWLRDHPPPVPDFGLTEFRQAMPDQYKVSEDAVSAYRKYYMGDKARFAVWTGRSVPDWFKKKELTFKKKGLTFKKKGLTFKSN